MSTRAFLMRSRYGTQELSRTIVLMRLDGGVTLASYRIVSDGVCGSFRRTIVRDIYVTTAPSSAAAQLSSLLLYTEYCVLVFHCLDVDGNSGGL